MEEKLGLYSYINFYSDTMRFRAKALNERKGMGTNEEEYAYSATDNELKEIIRSINDTVKDKYYLFGQELFREWTYVTTLFYDSSSKIRLRGLRQALLKEYNSTVISQYKKLTGIDLPELS